MAGSCVDASPCGVALGRRPDPCVSVASGSDEGIAMRAALKLPQLWRIMRAGTNQGKDFERRRGMSDTQSQTAQSGALHHGSAAIISANLVAGSLQNFERRARGKPHRLVFIKQNHGVREVQSGWHNRPARDLLLISCRLQRKGSSMTQLLVEPHRATRAIQIERTQL